jgi:peptidoglycan glycosyltransferase
LDRNGNVLASSKLVEGAQLRSYPYGRAFAHVVGYMNYGRTGIEAYSYLDLLKTDLSLVDRFKDDFTVSKPVGRSVVTTLDADLQVLARDLLGKNKGAIVALNPTTGEILAMVSTPDFDPNDIAKQYNDLAEDNQSATFLNRATQGLYPPGSTYKIITTIAYLEKNIADDFFYYCLGEDTFGEKIIHCYNNTAHGRITLEEAFAYSCNTSYAHIGELLDAKELSRISESLGYNNRIKMELETNISQFVFNSESSRSERAETVIGQGKTLVTPLNNALIVATIANKGYQVDPYLVNAIIKDGTYTSDIPLKTSNSKQVISADMAKTIESYMVQTSLIGTARALKNDSYGVASKTGSAENPTGAAHAWYVGYAPVNDPQIALAIVVENVGTSSINAVPLAKALYDAYLLKK